MHDFLIAYDYGMGGVWSIVKARTKEEVLARYPVLTVVEQKPDWMATECYDSLMLTAFHIDGEPPAWLAAAMKK